MLCDHVGFWKFIEPETEGCIIAADLTLDNACEARIEIYPMIYANVGGEVIPEIIVLAELPGDDFSYSLFEIIDCCFFPIPLWHESP